MKREFVKDYVDLEDSTFHGTAEQIGTVLKDIEEGLKKEGRKDIYFEWYSDYDYQVIRVYFLRPETDSEMNARRKRIQKKLEKLEKDKEKRHQLYLELKKEFEA